MLDQAVTQFRCSTPEELRERMPREGRPRLVAQIALEARLTPGAEVVAVSRTMRQARVLVDEAVAYLKTLGVRTFPLRGLEEGRQLRNGSRIVPAMVGAAARRVEGVRRMVFLEEPGDCLFTRKELRRVVTRRFRAFQGGFLGKHRGRRFVIGVDPGKVRDYSGIAIVEAVGRRCVLRHLERVALGTPYPEVVARVAALAAMASHVGRVTTVVDATGVGEAVADEMRAAEMRCGLQAVTITGGARTLWDGSRWMVPKFELVGGMKETIARRDMRVPGELAMRPEFEAELLSMGPLLRAEEGGHDDLVMAVGLAVWWRRVVSGQIASGVS